MAAVGESLLAKHRGLGDHLSLLIGLDRKETVRLAVFLLCLHDAADAGAGTDRAELATKADLADFATKADLNELRRETKADLHREIGTLRSELRWVLGFQAALILAVAAKLFGII